MKFLNTILLFLTLAGFAHAQDRPHCGTDEYMDKLLEENPSIAEDYALSEAILKQTAQQKGKKSTSAIVYKIPVVVHVIYNSEYDNISRSQIMDALRVLNEDFRRQNADKVNTRTIFQPVAADVEVEFELAKKDPQGNCTDGINRVQSSQSVNAHNNVKDLIQWDNDKYMNIWVVNSVNSSQSSGTILGYAYKPRFNQGFKTDGIVIRHDRMGTIGTSASGGRTLTHETGHYLGLDHPFKDGCNGGDGIADTPPVASSSFGCNLNRNSCSNDSPDQPDMIENFMDYADDVCQNIYTQDQKSFMRAALNTAGLRKELRLPSNHSITGLSAPPACPLTALISSENRNICPGDQVQFLDETEDGNPASYKWYFQGGQPSTSTSQNPAVTYAGPGLFDVSLVVINAAGSDSLFMEDFVSVKPYWSSYDAEWTEDFETGLSRPDVSVVSAEDDVKFEVTSQAAKNGSQSLYLNNYNADAPGAIDEFISPVIFTIFSNGLMLNFDYAFAGRSSDNSDQLRVMASEDCGKTWDLRRLFTGGMLRTAPDQLNGPFIPGSSQWRSGFVPLGGYDDKDPILIKFEFTNGGGNNLYIDNINLSAANVGADEFSLEHGVSIYPNPSQGIINIAFDRETQKEVQVELYDLYGKKVDSRELSKGTTSVTLDKKNLSSGVYMLHLTSGDYTRSQKIIIE